MDKVWRIYGLIFLQTKDDKWFEWVESYKYRAWTPTLKPFLAPEFHSFLECPDW